MQRAAPKKEVSRPSSWAALGLPVAALAFFGLSFLYVWRRIDPSLQYHYAAPVFCRGTSFFQPFAGYPGGLAEYGAAFLAQSNYHSWLGALVFTALGGLVFLATRRVLQQIGGRAVRLAAFGPPFLLLLLQDHYGSPVLGIGLGLLLGLGPAAAYAALPLRCAGLRLAACWVLAALVLTVGGLPCGLLFGALCGLFEGVRRRQRWLGLGCLASLLIGPAWMIGVSRAPLAGSFESWGEGWPLYTTLALYLFCPLAALLLALLPEPPLPAKSAAPGRPSGSTASRFLRFRRTDGFRWAAAAGLLLLGGAAVWQAFDGPRKAAIQISYYAGQGEWDKIPAIAAGQSVTYPSSQIHLIRALYHTGRLPEEMFSYVLPRSLDGMFVLGRGLEFCRAKSEALLELGQPGLAEHFAHEALEYDGDRPEVLKVLVRINLLKGRPQAARVFLNRLDQMPFQGEWVRRMRRSLAAGPGMAEDPELAQIRARMVATDLPHNEVPTERFLQQLLHTNRKNQMAFEYLMAHLLLTLQMDKLVAELGRLNDFNYAAIPRPWEEAILLVQQAKGAQAVDLRGRQIRPETRRRFDRFMERFKAHGYDRPGDREALRQEFGDTYCFYCLVRGLEAGPEAARPAEPVMNSSRAGGTP
jgi:hypothetical protein